MKKDWNSVITVALFGGLGNQLFQLAFAYTFSRRRGGNFQVDATWYNRSIEEFQYAGETPRKLYAKELAIVPEIRVLETMEYSRFGYYLARLRRKIGIYRNASWVLEPSQFMYEENVFLAASNAYFSGYWQHPNYSKDYICELKKIFSIKKYSSMLSVLAEEVKQDGVIALHIRLGDYKLVPSISELHGFCSEKYFEAAIDYFLQEKKIRLKKIFVFTDSVDLIPTKLVESYPILLVSQLGLSVLEEFELMKNAKYLIISNSTFSLWAAYLSECSMGNIVCPLPWLNTNLAANQLCLPHWVKLNKFTGERINGHLLKIGSF